MMGSTTFILVCAAEVTAVLLFIITILLLKNRKLQQLLHKLQKHTKDINSKSTSLKKQNAEAVTATTPTINNDSPNSQEELEQLKSELEQHKKRINNLNRFKSMYFELEERWNKCKDEASEHYTELKSIAANSDQQESFEIALNNYQATYQDIGQFIEAGVTEPAVRIDGQSQELSRLRNVAADQHRIINDLQKQLSSTSDTQKQQEIMNTMQIELEKQARFLQESETCIQLMDNELSTANKELELLRKKTKELPQIKAALKEIQTTNDTQEQTTTSLTQENKQLTKKLKLALETQPEATQKDSAESRQLRKELSTLQDNYNDLEERFLDIKSQG